MEGLAEMHFCLCFRFFGDTALDAAIRDRKVDLDSPGTSLQTCTRAGFIVELLQYVCPAFPWFA